MRIGLRLRGSSADIAALAVLGERVPHLVDRPWTTFADPRSSASVITQDSLELVTARAFVERGLDMVVWTHDGDDLRIMPLREGEEEARWTAPAQRDAALLIEALRPTRLVGEPVVDEALFVMDPGSGEPHKLLERLLLLDRGDATVCEFEVEVEAGEDAAARLFAVKVRAPPIYLLMRARDDDSAPVDVYARDGKSPLWVAWSFAHPLAEAAAANLRRREQTALVDRSGRWLRGPAQWRTRSIYDALLPELDARAATLRPVDGALRFAIALRLAPAPPADAELWLLDADELLALEPLIEGATGDELSRLTVARLTDGRRTRYLLRERVRPGVPPIAARVSEALGVDGFARVAGADNLYLPSGRRLRPMLRRDDLRRLLALDEAHTVLLVEDGDGLAIVKVPEVDEAPLLRWIDYVATDRRLALDQLLERSVFEFPDVSIDWPEVARVKPERPPPRERATKRRSKRARQRIAADAEEVAAEDGVEEDEGARLRELRAEARELERELAVGGVDDPEPWVRLGELKLALDEADEGVACLEIGLFHGGAPYAPELAATLRDAHVGLLHRGGAGDLLMELLIADRRTPGEVAAVAAILIARIAAGRPPADEVMQLALPIFRDPRLPIARRLAWGALAAWHGHAGDRLGMTRAKEAILGGVNERGLSELHDLPRFVRYALTVDAGEDDDEGAREKAGERLRQGQLVALEELWRIAETRGLEELDAQSNYVRLIFAVGFARLGARSSAQEIVAPVIEELDVHEPPNRGLFRLYLGRLAHEASGGSDEAWQAEVRKQRNAVRGVRERKAVTWLQRRSLWLATDEDAVRRRGPGRRRGYTLPAHVDLAGLAENLGRDMKPKDGNYDYIIADAVEAHIDRALASGSEALIAEVLVVADANLQSIAILGHRAEAIGHCIRGAANLGDDLALDHLLGRLVEVAEDPKLGSVRELAEAVRRGLVALRRFGGIEPARGLLEALSGVSAYTAAGTIELQSTVASGLVQLGEEAVAEVILSRLVAQIFDGSFDYVSRCEAGIAVASALRHWPNVARITHCGRFLSDIDVFRDTFTTNRYYDTHKILILEAIVDSLADAQTRHSDQIQGFLDLEEHALRRRIIADWSALCGP